MASALSVDLRERIVAAMEAGASRREAARRFEVGPAGAVPRPGMLRASRPARRLCRRVGSRALGSLLSNGAVAG